MMDIKARCTVYGRPIATATCYCTKLFLQCCVHFLISQHRLWWWLVGEKLPKILRLKRYAGIYSCYPHTHGITVVSIPITTVLPWTLSPCPQYYRHFCPLYRGYHSFTAVPIPMQLSSDYVSVFHGELLFNCLQSYRYMLVVNAETVKFSLTRKWSDAEEQICRECRDLLFSICCTVEFGLWRTWPV